MKEMRKNLLPIVLIAVFVQGCSSMARVSEYNEPDRIVATLNEMQLLANELGNTELNEIYVNHRASVDTLKEFRVIQEYTAASGRYCKEVTEMDVGSSVSLTPKVVCQNMRGDWYWPRQIILK